MSNMKNILMKITAWLLLIWCSLLSLGAISLIFVISFSIRDANILKLVLVDGGLVVLASLIFIVGLGCFEFITSFVKVQEKIADVDNGKPTLPNEPVTKF